MESCYRNSLELAVKNGIKTIAFPSISTGAYRFPIDRAAQIAINEIKRFFETDLIIEKVLMVCFDVDTFQVFFIMGISLYIKLSKSFHCLVGIH